MVDFELKPSLINMVRAIAFNGNPSKDASAHLYNFLETCGTISIKGIRQDVIRLYLFPFSLRERAKHWFYHNLVGLDTWEKCSNNFLAKFFLVGKTNLFCSKISIFQRENQESVREAWECMQQYVQACPHHGMQDWLFIQSFYHGLFLSPIIILMLLLEELSFLLM